MMTEDKGMTEGAALFNAPYVMKLATEHWDFIVYLMGKTKSMLSEEDEENMKTGFMMGFKHGFKHGVMDQ